MTHTRSHNKEFIKTCMKALNETVIHCPAYFRFNKHLSTCRSYDARSAQVPQRGHAETPRGDAWTPLRSPQSQMHWGSRPAKTNCAHDLITRFSGPISAPRAYATRINFIHSLYSQCFHL